MMRDRNSGNMLEYETLKLMLLSIIGASVSPYKFISTILYGMAIGWSFVAGLLILIKYKEIERR